MNLPRLALRLHAGSVVGALCLCVFCVSATLQADEAKADAAKREFFENRIRPVLVESCYECHNSATAQEGGLVLDHRAGLLKGGDNGVVIVPGKPDESRLLKTLRHELAGLEMPQGGYKLDQQQIADFERWIRDGAFDPRDEPPAAELAEATSWETVFAKRKESWRYVPPIASPEPAVIRGDWPAGTIDRFLLAKMEQAGLEPGEETDRRKLLRRWSYVLTGLPPTREEIAAFLADEASGAYERQVDRLLESERFGERWARHWMDWLRYAETHGSEGDPAIPFAWRFRDWLIRSLNDDVPVDRLIAETVAGDLLPDPRIDEAAGVNLSAIGPAQFRFVQHGFAPTDALDEKVRFTDNQVDVVTKAYLGLTVACARCHDHKFDAVSQADYYALFGIAANCRPATVTIDVPERGQAVREELSKLKQEIRTALAEDWLVAAKVVPDSLTKGVENPAWKGVIDAAKEPTDPLHAWRECSGLEGESFALKWKALAKDFGESRKRLEPTKTEKPKSDNFRRWSLGQKPDFDVWIKHGTGLAGDAPSRPGEFFVSPDGERAIDGPYPAGIYSHSLSSKESGVAGSPRFEFDRRWIYLRAIGDGEARARYVVQNYPRNGTVYPVDSLNGGDLRWIRWEVDYWAGDEGYLEVSTAADQPVVGDPKRERSWFGVVEARFVSDEEIAAGQVPRDEIAEFVAPLFEDAEAPTNRDELSRRYAEALTNCIQAFADDSMADEQALFLRFFVRSGLLPSKPKGPAKAGTLIAKYREVEATLPVPTRAPGVQEGESRDQPLLVRGDHKQPAEPVERRFVSAIDGASYKSAGSGRLELARSLTDPANPLTSRVMVNRVWHHVFGRGIVGTPDNFGVLGEQPTHPELLDTLAVRFAREGWSLKRLVREMVLSRAFRQSSVATEAASSVDPENRLLSHMSVRRLEAEAVRDAALAASGRLELTPFGEPVGEGSARRSVYVDQRRTAMPPLLSAFDAPAPFSTVGRRDVTNVPAQSLALLNDPFVIGLAKSWAERLVPDPIVLDEGARVAVVDAAFETAFARLPETEEREALLAYVASCEAAAQETQKHAERLKVELSKLRREREALLGPARARLAESADAAEESAVAHLRPIAAWEFDDDARDSIGQLHVTLHGAKLAEGGLVLDGNSHASAGPLPSKLTAKTLEAWVTLADLDQRGGGVLSVQTKGGERFDAIVFGEQEPRRWLAGSDFFRRTKSFEGPDEADADKRPVHVALAYSADGTIAAYRDGKAYGKPYRSEEPLTFEAGEAEILFGLRHGPPGGNRMLQGRILRAALYDRALTAEEVALAAKAIPSFVSEADLLASLSEADRQRVADLDRRLTETSRELEAIPERDRTPDPRRAWADLALALFNLKEFVYVR